MTNFIFIVLLCKFNLFIQELINSTKLMEKIIVKYFVVSILFLSQSLHVQSQDDITIVKGIADKILKETETGFVGKTTKAYYPTTESIPDDEDVFCKSQYADWHYSMGVLDMAMLNLSKVKNNPAYSQFALDHIDNCFANKLFFEKRKSKFPGGPYNSLLRSDELDDFGAMGAAIIDANQLSAKKSYSDFIQLAASHIMNKQPRLADGTLVRTWPYKMTLWADDLYMGVSFLARMGKYSQNNIYYDDAIKQVLNFNKYLWNPTKELYYHAYYADLDCVGGAHWGRCNGWIMLATVHLLNALPENYPNRTKIIDLLKRHITGVSHYQDSDGLWHQLLDKSDSYSETSCSTIFVYSVARAINQGWLDKRYASIAIKGWDGLRKQKITPDFNIKDICVGTGIGTDITFYYLRPRKDNDIHGIGLIIDAGLEIIKLKKTLNLK